MHSCDIVLHFSVIAAKPAVAPLAKPVAAKPAAAKPAAVTVAAKPAAPKGNAKPAAGMCVWSFLNNNLRVMYLNMPCY